MVVYKIVDIDIDPKYLISDYMMIFNKRELSEEELYNWSLAVQDVYNKIYEGKARFYTHCSPTRLKNLVKENEDYNLFDFKYVAGEVDVIKLKEDKTFEDLNSAFENQCIVDFKNHKDELVKRYDEYKNNKMELE